MKRNKIPNIKISAAEWPSLKEEILAEWNQVSESELGATGGYLEAVSDLICGRYLMLDVVDINQKLKTLVSGHGPGDRRELEDEDSEGYLPTVSYFDDEVVPRYECVYN